MRALIILLFMTSCTALYAPSTRNAPLFREQGEAQLSAYLSSGGVEGQVAYAVTDNIAVTGGYAWHSVKKPNPSTPPAPANPDYDHKNSYGEIGIGYYDRSRTARYEIIAGYGFGQGTNLDQYYFYGLNNNVAATGKMNKIFIQPSIGTNNRDLNLILTPRLSWVNYYEFEYNGNVQKPIEGSVFFIEPSGTAKFRLTGNIHGLFQLGVSFPVSEEPIYNFIPVQAGIGLQIDTGGMRARVYK